MKKQTTAKNNFNHAAGVLKALAHPLRLEIACGLRTTPCTQTFMSRVLGVPQPTIAQHLKVLRANGVIKSERDGLEVIFSLNDPKITVILDTLCEGKECGEHAAYSWDELADIEKERRRLGGAPFDRYEYGK